LASINEDATLWRAAKTLLAAPSAVLSSRVVFDFSGNGNFRLAKKAKKAAGKHTLIWIRQAFLNLNNSVE